MVNGESHRDIIFLKSPCQYVSGMADDSTGRGSDKFMLRLPDGMRDRLKAWAEANKRSMNAEIVARLEQSLGDSLAEYGDQPEVISQKISDLISSIKKIDAMVSEMKETVWAKEDQEKT